MNNFFLNEDPNISTPFKVANLVPEDDLDETLKFTLEYLCTAHRVCDGNAEILDAGHGDIVYKLHDERENTLLQACNVDDSIAIWVRKSVENYMWMVDFMHSLHDIYKKKHLMYDTLAYSLNSPPFNVTEWDFTPFYK